MTDKAESQKPTVNPPPEDGIGDRIKEARQRPAYDLSVEALSRLSRAYDAEGQGITSTTLLRYEQGKVKPGARELRILCDALDVSADWLLFGVENPMGMSLAEGLALLADLVGDRGKWRNPLGRRRGEMDAVRAEQILQAKVPQKR